MINGEIIFNTPDPDYNIALPAGIRGRKVDNAYRTLYGPSFDSNGVIYGDCDTNTRYMWRRMSALRKPADWFIHDGTEHQKYQAYHQLLNTNQTKYINENMWFYDTFLANKYNKHFEDYEGHLESCIHHHDDPHDKRDLRIQGLHSLIHNCDRVNFSTKGWCLKVLYKMKKDEIAKMYKYPRAIGDLGVIASLLGFWFTHKMKEAQASESFVYKGITFEFIKKPMKTALASVAEKLINPPGRGYFPFFSDDSCFSIRVAEKIFIYNLDISSCDSSHGNMIFQAYKKTFPVKVQPDVEMLLNQCRTPLTIYSRYDKKMKVKLVGKTDKMPSGVTITTGVNNIATMTIGKALADANLTEENLDQQLQQAAVQTGYNITVERCHTYHQIQFLKHSPYKKKSGEYGMMLNVGTLLRSLGVRRGDLPGPKTMSLRDRANAETTLLLRGMYPTTDFELLRVLKTACHSTYSNTQMERHVEKVTAYKVAHQDDDETTYVETSEICKRYGLLGWEYDQLIFDLKPNGFGRRIANRASAKILSIDYGLTCGE